MKFVNPHVFIFFQDGKIGLWDYVNHEHFEIEPEYLHRIAELAAAETAVETDSVCDAELVRSGVVSIEPFTPIQWGWSRVAEIFHFAGKNFGTALPADDEDEYVNQYIDVCTDLYDGVEEADLRHRRQGPRIVLEPPDVSRLENVSLWHAIHGRKTTRTFLGEDVSLADLSLMLYAAFGEIHGRWNELEERGLRVLGIRKSAPSGGATHSCQQYVVALRVDGLEAGVYHYESDNHALVKISDINCTDSIGALLSGQHFANQLSAGIFITSCFDKVWVKYKHSRAYRVPYIDLGHVSQTFHLTANALGLNSWLSGAFEDDEVSGLLGLEPFDAEQPLFFVGVGKGTGDPLHPRLNKAIDSRLRAAGSDRPA